MSMYAGQLNYDPKEIGRLNKNTVENTVLGSVHQPQFAGWCTPTLHLRDTVDLQDTPYGKFEGPHCFGGWSELCCDFKFFVSRWESERKTGDLALITKKKPVGFSGAAADLFTNADVYTISFSEDIKVTPEQKVTILGSQILADYMYFDGNTEKCSVDDKGNIWCHFFYCSCIGLLVPCSLVIPIGNNN